MTKFIERRTHYLILIYTLPMTLDDVNYLTIKNLSENMQNYKKKMINSSIDLTFYFIRFSINPYTYLQYSFRYLYR